MAYAWTDRVVSQGSLNQQVYTLRQLLGDEKSRQIIQTLPRRGYLLNPEFVIREVALPEQPSPPPPSEPAQQSIAETPQDTSPPRRRMYQGIRCALAAGVLALVAPLSLMLRTERTWQQEEYLGALHVLYLGSPQIPLDELMNSLHRVAARMAELAHQPTTLTLTSSDSAYLLLCRHQGANAHWLEVPHERLSRLSDAQLLKCLQ